LAGRLERPITAETTAAAFEAVFSQQPADPDWSGGAEFAAYSERQGGWWGEAGAPLAGRAAGVPAEGLEAWQEPEFQGGDEFPLHFQPYPSVQFGEGSGAHLPWLQETPDPASSAMWGLPIEVDPRTAAALEVRNGDLVRVISPAGEIEAPVYVHPAAIPGVVSMAIGQGHAHYGRYASGRGANPLAIVAPVAERGTGVPAFGATRVRLEKTNRQGSLVQWAREDREPHLSRP